MQPPSVVRHEHLLLPDKDGNFVRNFLEPPQSTLLNGSLLPRLQELHPDGQYCIGQDSGIYWRRTDPPLAGCKAPDWYYIPGVAPMLEGQYRRSYVLWEEVIRPLVIVEYVSGDGSEERDATPFKGKFWVYEQAIAARYYAIYEVEKASVEVYRLYSGSYQRVEANAAGRFPIEPLGAELGIWQGTYQGMELPWLRVWDSATGQLMPSTEEREAAERKRAESERRRAENEKRRAESAESLLDDAKRRLEEECERAENERREKENERREKENERREKENEQRRAEKLAERLRALGIDPEAL